MREAVVVASSRTALAKSFRGSLNRTRPDEMVAHCLKHVLDKAPGLDYAEIEDVIIGCAYPERQQGNNIARVASLLAGLPAEVAAVTVNRFCSSGLQSVAMAAHQIVQEGVTVAIGGGVEFISGLTADETEPNPWLQEHFPGIYMVMGDTAEVVAKRYQIGRQAQDEFALLSQQRTARAQELDLLASEIAPFQVNRGIWDRETRQIAGEEPFLLERDECNRPDTTLEGLAALKPYFDPDSGDGTVTAGNASQLSDGASATLLMSRERAVELGIQPLVAFRGFTVAGCKPAEMGIGPVFAVPKLLERQGLSVSDIGLWELNEAFAVQVIYCRDQLGIDAEKLNVNGGSIAVGHPFGMTGSRLVGTLAYEMQRRQVRFGVVTMCIGGGQGAAGLFELCS
ncbi:MAG TPA: thiolase family protein [Planctomycetes bacterium]|nr:thiolase family protein [Planctomycetaceae bacterium]HIN94343.1 thiolase family protein [Planctomycetota bacterium]